MAAAVVALHLSFFLAENSGSGIFYLVVYSFEVALVVDDLMLVGLAATLLSSLNQMEV